MLAEVGRKLTEGEMSASPGSGLEESSWQQVGEGRWVGTRGQEGQGEAASLTGK